MIFITHKIYGRITDFAKNKNVKIHNFAKNKQHKNDNIFIRIERNFYKMQMLDCQHTH